jgi:iron-sulfur cluster assembly protein
MSETTNIETATAPAKSITITEKALSRVRAVLAQEGLGDTGGIRLGVQGGGCSGLSYVVQFESGPHERDRIFTFGNVRVFVDPKSFIYLAGMTVDYEETLMKTGFVFHNPNAAKSCGCGSSFTA